MGRKNRNVENHGFDQQRLHRVIKPRKIVRSEQEFAKSPRRFRCLHEVGQAFLEVEKLESTKIRHTLAYCCRTIEHQIITLRHITQLTPSDYENRYTFSQLFLSCLRKHHNIIYEGIMFGSSVNGLGFRDSDVDLRLRPLKKVDANVFEPVIFDDKTVDTVLRNIAYQTTSCCPSIGEYVPSSRCPVAKLQFLKFGNPRIPYPLLIRDIPTFKSGLKYDVSMSSNSLGTFNSLYLRFLCNLEPKFHLLATVLRYWSNVHELIVPGYLSSYALVNMLVFFCQTIQPPLLPTVDQMRETYIENTKEENGSQSQRALTQTEWQCMVSLDKSLYSPSENTEPLSVLLLKFFELYLSFPYSTKIITTRPGRALGFEEFKLSSQYHPRFALNQYLNIQDPFEARHNLTLGLIGEHFRKLIVTMRYSYERLFKELMNNFSRLQGQLPNVPETPSCPKLSVGDPKLWGLNILFTKLTKQELLDAC